MSHHSSSSRLSRFRPALEPLENRTLPTVFIVINLADFAPGSLREAISKANDEENHPGPDVIEFAPAVQGGTFFLAASERPSIDEQAGPSAFYISSPITIQGTGETITRSDLAPTFRLFHVAAQSRLTLRNVTLSGGRAQGGEGLFAGGGAAGLGGAIYNQGTLTIAGSTLHSNLALGGFGGNGLRTGGGGGLGEKATSNRGGEPDGGRNGGRAGFGGGGEGSDDQGGPGGFGGGGGGGGINDPTDGGGGGGFGGGGGGGSNPAHSSFGGGAGSDAGYGGGGAGMGGAIFNQGGTVSIINSTLAGNIARGGFGHGSGGGGSGLGGGIFNLNGSVTLTNATLAGNTVIGGTSTTGAAGLAQGKGVYNLSFNALKYPGGPSATPAQSATLTIGNSILIGPAFPDGSFVNHQIDGTATVVGTAPNIIGFPYTNINGLIEGVSAFTVANPDLGPLKNNGGYTPTMAPNPGSPVINAGANGAAEGLLSDQRGGAFLRVFGGTVDIGAFEVQPPRGSGPRQETPNSPQAVSVVLVPVRRGKKRRLAARVLFNGGPPPRLITSPFQKPGFRSVATTLLDLNGDGVKDGVLFTARRGKKKVSRTIAL